LSKTPIQRFEVAMKFRGCAIGESAVEDLPANERLMVGKSVAPDEARDFPRSLTDRGEIEELRGGGAAVVKGHHRIGAPKVDGQCSLSRKMKVLFVL
jgi:hypothetical protein